MTEDEYRNAVLSLLAGIDDNLEAIQLAVED